MACCSCFLLFLLLCSAQLIPANSGSVDQDMIYGNGINRTIKNLNRNRTWIFDSKLNNSMTNFHTRVKSFISSKDVLERKPRSQNRQFLVARPVVPTFAVPRVRAPLRLSAAAAFLIPAIPTLLGNIREYQAFLSSYNCSRIRCRPCLGRCSEASYHNKCIRNWISFYQCDGIHHEHKQPNCGTDQHQHQ